MRKYAVSQKSTFESNDLVFDERCPDCEYNGYLNNAGDATGETWLWCGRCSSGRIRLLTVEDIKQAKEPADLLARIARGRARLVRSSELVDPYLVKKKG